MPSSASVSVITIKRYANRKLYNTASRKYISLDDLTHCVLQGEKICVIEHSSGKDITAAILAQILHRQEKHQSTNLPAIFLSPLIRMSFVGLSAIAGSDKIINHILGSLERELHEHITQLVEAGSLSIEEGESLLLRNIPINNSLNENHADEFHHSDMPLSHAVFASKSDLQLLQKAIEAIDAKVESLLEHSI